MEILAGGKLGENIFVLSLPLVRTFFYPLGLTGYPKRESYQKGGK